MVRHLECENANSSCSIQDAHLFHLGELVYPKEDEVCANTLKTVLEQGCRILVPSRPYNRSEPSTYGFVNFEYTLVCKIDPVLLTLGE